MIKDSNSCQLQFVCTDTPECHLHRFDQPLFIEFHFVYTGYTVVTMSFGKRPPMIDDVPVVVLRVVDYRMMTGTGSHCRILFQNGSDPLKGSQGRVGDGVGYPIIGIAPSSFRPHEIVFSVFPEHEGSLGIPFGSHLLKYSPSGKGLMPVKSFLRSTTLQCLHPP